MMMQKRSFLLFLGIFTLFFAQAQTQDSVVLGYEAYLGPVLENHPLAKQAEIQGATGAQYLRASRGAFDPYLAANWDAKQFAGKNYWQIFEGSLRVPTWYGVELYSGWNSATGTFLNPSQNIPSSGQAVLGIEVNLGKGLLIDQRRAELQKAKAYVQMTEAQQRSLLNNLIADATFAYWNWSMDYNNLLTYQEALQLADQRFVAIRSSYQRGEEPAIDTLEAFIQVQVRRLNLSEAGASLAKSARDLNNYLWDPNGQPVEFEANLRPISSANAIVRDLPVFSEELVDSLIFGHPELTYYQYQGVQLAVEERWRKEQLKPDLAIKYQALSAQANNDDLIGQMLPNQNLKWGLKFSFPLFLRKQRGYLELARLAIDQNQYFQDQKQNELRNKLGALQAQIVATAAQIEVSRDMVINYKRMVAAEIEKFELGESSIFLINTREQKLIDAELKLNSLLAKLPILIGEANRASGGYLLGR